MKNWLSSKIAFSLLPILLFFTFCYWVTDAGLRGNLENPFLRERVYPKLSWASNVLTDLKFKVRGAQSPKNKIVVVEIDNASIEALGRWPWHRDAMAFLIEKSMQAGAQVVGLDMVFSEPDPRISDELIPVLQKQGLQEWIEKLDTDRQLAEVIQKYSDRLVLGWVGESICQPLYSSSIECPVHDPKVKELEPVDFEKFSITDAHYAAIFQPQKTPVISVLSTISNLPSYHVAAKHSGFFNAFLDSDSTIRKSALAAFYNSKLYPSLSLEMARAGLKEDLSVQVDSKQHLSEIRFKNSRRKISASSLGSLQINFRGMGSLFPHVSALDVLKSDGQDAVGKLLKDAYVLVGISAIGVFDMREFPFESNAPGVDGHAQVLDNILGGDPLVPEPHTAWLVLAMTVGAILFAWTISRLDAVPALLLFLGTFAGVGFLDFRVLFHSNSNWNTVFFYLELGTLFVFTLAIKYVLEERNKKFIRSAFSKYVAPAVVDSILKNPKNLSLGGEKREMTILFSDIRGFTSFSENMDAKQLAAFLNDYLSIMTRIIFEYQGTLDKYIGDAIMAFWGAPLHQSNHALLACQAALKMNEALKANFQRFKDQYGIEVHAGIGINSGVVNVGNMGSEQNFEYTVIGDHVNLASRVEGLTKKYGVQAMTTEYTLGLLSTLELSQLFYRHLDAVKVKGKKNAVGLIELLSQPLEASQLQIYAEAQDLYRTRKWDAAIQKLRSLPEDGPAQTLIEHCEAYKRNPPSPDWDGSWEMDSK